MKFGSRWKWIALLLITALGAAIRFYRLADFPPGLSHDEAFHQVAALSVYDGYYPLYFPENMGMDPMLAYMIGFLYKVVGVTAIGARIISALAGTLTIPATWWLAGELFADWSAERRTAVSAASAFVLATLQWHITLSRTGIQPSLVPPLLTMTMATLWRGLRKGGWAWFVGAGVFLGAGLYAYSAARMAPLLIAGVALWLFLFERETFRLRWRGLLLFVAVSMLVFAPLAGYFIRNPYWFTLRARQVTQTTLGEGSGGPLQNLWQNALKTLAAFTIRGDMDVIRNWPGRPVLDPFQSALFLLAIAACLRYIRRPAYATLLAWLGAMSLPTILTEYAPHYARGIGLTPAVATLVGLGTVTVWRWGERLSASRTLRTRALVRRGTALALGLGLVASAIGHGYTYFIRWGSMPELFLPYDVGLLSAAREIRERVPEAAVYFSPISVGHPIPRFILWDRPGARSYDGRYSLVLPAHADRTVDYVIVSTMDKRSLSRLREIYPQGEIVGQGGYENGIPYYEVYRVPPGSEARVIPQRQAQVIWGDRIGLFGYDLNQERYRPGENVVLALYWRSLVPVEESFTVFTHLLGPVRPGTDSAVWAGSDQEPGRASYPTSAWQTGEVIVDEFVLTVPADAPPGEYDVEIGLYQWQTMQRLPVTRADVKAGSDYAILTTIAVGD
jgi:4-amino-4-deoxy-L-arabinose transferase-like glycosyltransferase